MITLSYGYQLPQNPDTGDIFYPALAFDINQLNNHNHDGITSAPLAVTSQAISSANWTAASVGGGLYQQTITLPTTPPFSYDTCVITFRKSTGEPAYPSLTRVSTTQYIIFCNDNTVNYVAYYR